MVLRQLLPKRFQMAPLTGLFLLASFPRLLVPVAFEFLRHPFYFLVMRFNFLCIVRYGFMSSLHNVRLKMATD